MAMKPEAQKPETAQPDQPAPDGAGPQGMTADDAKALSDAISQKAVDLMNGMQQLVMVLQKIGVDEGSLKQLVGNFEGFVSTLKAILGGGGAAPEAPETEGSEHGQMMKGNQPRDMMGGHKGAPMM